MTEVYKRSLDYHKKYPNGKIEVNPSKKIDGSDDLTLAYTPGVAEPCKAIAKDPSCAYEYTTKGNLVAVISNGTAVLGLGDIGALASKPVMEGKAVLFKHFAGVNAFDIEINESDPKKLIEIIAALEPTFGGINLEDIKAPECFEIERELSNRLSIPVFHDDQHGTAIVVAAALLNALKLVSKKLDEIKLVVSGAGAAAIACIDLLTDLGLKNVTVCDSKGVISLKRTDILDESKRRYMKDTDDESLACAIKDADVFLGVSKGGLLTSKIVDSMNKDPIVFALANPEPEILPTSIERKDVIVATGRSDFANQVNNVLCFPYLFKGALKVRATKITKKMMHACVNAISEIVHSKDDSGKVLSKDYIIPSIFDKRLIEIIPDAVANAAIEDGVARLSSF